MTDIVERLRGLADEWYEMCGDIHEPLGEAADEIERLRATLDQTRRFALSGEMDTVVSDEIERLREALRYYAKNHYPDIDAGPWGPNSNDWGDVARAALGENE